MSRIPEWHKVISRGLRSERGRREVDVEASSQNSYGRVCLVTRDKGYSEVDLGVAVGNFGGDGGYPVFAEIDERGMVATVTVDFSGSIGYQMFGLPEEEGMSGEGEGSNA